jgi:acetylornithine deacetylase/succinyl-diaminopimelate desuccinylase-like protein
VTTTAPAPVPAAVLDGVDGLLTRALDRLGDLLRIPSVSGDPAHAGDVRRAAVWLRDELAAWGWEDARLLETAGAPLVTGLLRAADPDAPTVVLYCHYDVQPAEPVAAWSTPPFMPTVVDGHLHARGAADDKGPILVHLAALRAWMEAEGAPPVSVRLLLEGEEESGSPSLPAALREHAGLFAADLLVVSDTSMLGEDRPSLCYGLRGLAALEVRVRGAAQDLHSGKYGGVAPNAALVLARLLAALHDADGRVAIPGFYDAVRDPDPEERARLHALGFDDRAWRAGAGVRGTAGEAGWSALERAWLRPTLDVNGMTSGFTGEGTKTIIPATATAKLSARLVPDQQPAVVAALVAAHLRALAPAGIHVEVEVQHGGRPVCTPTDSPAVRAALAAYETGYGTAPALTREGGSVPVVADLVEALGVPALLLGFGLPDQREHAPDERLSLRNAQRAARTCAAFWHLLARETT